MKNLIIVALLGFSALAFAEKEVGDVAPCGELNHLYTDGSEKVESVCAPLQSTKFVMIEFFSTTCGYCIRNLPKISKLHTELSDVATFRYIGIDRDTERVREFVKAYGEFIHFPVAFDNTRSVYKAFENVGTPTLFMVDTENKIVYKHVGEMNEADLESLRRFVRGN